MNDFVFIDSTIMKVVRALLILFTSFLQQECGSDIHRSSQRTYLVMHMATMFSNKLFTQLFVAHISSTSMTTSIYSLSESYINFYQQLFDDSLVVISKQEDSFAVFHILSEVCRTLSVLMVPSRSDLLITRTLDVSSALEIVAAFGKFHHYSIHSLSKMVGMMQLLQILARPIKCRSDYIHFKTRLKGMKDKNCVQHDNREIEIVQLWESGEQAAKTLDNIRVFIHFLIMLHKAPFSVDLVDDPKYAESLDDVFLMISIQFSLVLVDLNELTTCALKKVLRMCLSVLDFKVSLDRFSVHRVRCSVLDILPYFLENVWQKSVQHIQALYYAQSQRIGFTIPANNGLQSSSNTYNSNIMWKKDTMELFQECAFYVELYFSIVPFSAADDIHDDNKLNHFKSEIELMTEIHEQMYTTTVQLPTETSYNRVSSISKSRYSLRTRTDDLFPVSSNSWKSLEYDFIDTIKKLLFDYNRCAWATLITIVATRSFPALLRIEYSPNTILIQDGEDIVIRSVHSKPQCISYYHEYGYLTVFIPLNAITGRQGFHHHILFDVITEVDHTPMGTFNLFTNSHKMERVFNVIYVLMVIKTGLAINVTRKQAVTDLCKYALICLQLLPNDQ
jgi:hypothetical protein